MRVTVSQSHSLTARVSHSPFSLASALKLLHTYYPITKIPANVDLLSIPLFFPLLAPSMPCSNLQNRILPIIICCCSKQITRHKPKAEIFQTMSESSSSRPMSRSGSFSTSSDFAPPSRVNLEKICSKAPQVFPFPLVSFFLSVVVCFC